MTNLTATKNEHFEFNFANGSEVVYGTFEEALQWAAKWNTDDFYAIDKPEKRLITNLEAALRFF